MEESKYPQHHLLSGLPFCSTNKILLQWDNEVLQRTASQFSVVMLADINKGKQNLSPSRVF
jgi:hypothetical protein